MKAFALFAVFSLFLSYLPRSFSDDDTNGDGVVDDLDEPQLPKLVALTPAGELTNRLVPGVYVSVSEIKGFHISSLHVKGQEFEFFVFGCTGGYSESGKVEFSKGWFKAGLSYWHPSKLNGRDVLWRDDAWKIWSNRKRFYDYGMLVRVDEADPKVALKNPPSVSVLYDPERIRKAEEWRDPFVHGPRR